MKKYIAKRILLAIPMLFAISFIAFMLINIMPSDPAEVALRVNEIIPTEEAIESMRMELGLNDPFFLFFFNWIGDCLRLDFCVSYTNTTRNVFDEIVALSGYGDLGKNILMESYLTTFSFLNFGKGSAMTYIVLFFALLLGIFYLRNLNKEVDY